MPVNLVTGKSSNRWSLITIRMGMSGAYILFVIYCSCVHVYTPYTTLAVYSRSPAAFEALWDFNILQVPGSEYTEELHEKQQRGSWGMCQMVSKRALPLEHQGTGACTGWKTESTTE